MYFYPDWNLSLFSIPGCQNKDLFNLLGKRYSKNDIKEIKTSGYDWKNISTQQIFIRVKPSFKICLIRHPLDRMVQLFKILDNHPKLSVIPHKTFEQFIHFLFKNRENIFTSNHNMNFLTVLQSQLNILTRKDNHMNFDLILNIA